MTYKSKIVPETAADALRDGTPGRDDVLVQVGDRIAYSVKWGSSAVIQLATVLGFRDARDSVYGSNGTTVKIEIKADGNDRPSLIEAKLRRFVRIPG